MLAHSRHDNYRFNPLFIGAGIRTCSTACRLSTRALFQSPLHRGGYSDLFDNALGITYEAYVSIPSSSGRVFGQQIIPWDGGWFSRFKWGDLLVLYSYHLNFYRCFAHIPSHQFLKSRFLNLLAKKCTLWAYLLPFCHRRRPALGRQ